MHERLSFIYRSRWRYLFSVIIVCLYVMPVVLSALNTYFTGDDVMNLNYHRFQNRPSDAVVNSFLFYRPYRRPVGGCVYLILYSIFGIRDPFPFYATGLLIFLANVGLLFWLLLKLKTGVPTAILASSFASLHWELSDIWYNFGAVYELLAFGLMMAGFHFYLSSLSAKLRKRYTLYGLSLVSYVLAIGSKEMAVTLPALLMVYELIYRTRKGILWTCFCRSCLRLIPFIAVGLIATYGKLHAYGDNPLYNHQFDLLMLDNLRHYLDKIFFGSFLPGRWQILLVLVVTFAAGLLFRNRHMIFGWFYFLIALMPVIALPRVWGLFLYIPLVGVGLYLAAAVVDVTRLLWRIACQAIPSTSRLSKPIAAGSILLCLFGLADLHYETAISHIKRNFLNPGAVRRDFDRQLFAMYKDFPKGTALLFLRSPHEGWNIHHTVYLLYENPDLKVLAGPNLDHDKFKKYAEKAAEYHIFDYRHGKLELVR